MDEAYAQASDNGRLPVRPRQIMYAARPQILKLTGSKSTLVNKPLPADDPKQRKPDISLAKKLLGWEPKVGREEGLRRTIEYFKRQVR